MNFFIIHGIYGHPEENWFPWLKKELEKFKHSAGHEVVSLRKGFEKLAVQAELPSRFKETDNLVVVNGWIPRESFPSLKGSLDEIHAFVEMVTSSDLPPSKLSNPALVSLRATALAVV